MTAAWMVVACGGKKSGGGGTPPAETEQTMGVGQSQAGSGVTPLQQQGTTASAPAESEDGGSKSSDDDASEEEDGATEAESDGSSDGSTTVDTSFDITGISKMVATPGESLTLNGTNFLPALRVSSATTATPPSISVLSSTEATLSLPSTVPFGTFSFSLTQGGEEQELALFSNGGQTDYPVITAGADTVCSGENFYDEAGVLRQGTRSCGTPAACAADGATSCVANASFPAANASGLAGKVLNGETVAGVAGNVTIPAAANVLTGTSYGVGGSGTSGTLTLPSAANVRASAGSYGAGGNGTSPTLADCSSDGQTGCVTTASYPAAAVSGFSTWNLRIGTTLAGISGALKTACRNAADSTRYNYDGDVTSLPNTSVTSGTQYDHWDTIEDFYGQATGIVSGWSSNTLCDAGVWEDVTTTNGGSALTTCGTSSTCIYRNRIMDLRMTGLISSGGNTTDTSAPLSANWTTAVQTCAQSTYGGYSAGSWRLPTQKELMAISIHGLTNLADSDFLTLANMQDMYWSSTTHSPTPANARYVYLANGGGGNSVKTTTYKFFCVQ